MTDMTNADERAALLRALEQTNRDYQFVGDGDMGVMLDWEVGERFVAFHSMYDNGHDCGTFGEDVVVPIRDAWTTLEDRVCAARDWCFENGVPCEGDTYPIFLTLGEDGVGEVPDQYLPYGYNVPDWEI